MGWHMETGDTLGWAATPPPPLLLAPYLHTHICRRTFTCPLLGPLAHSPCPLETTPCSWYGVSGHYPCQRSSPVHTPQMLCVLLWLCVWRISTVVVFVWRIPMIYLLEKKKMTYTFEKENNIYHIYWCAYFSYMNFNVLVFLFHSILYFPYILHQIKLTFYSTTFIWVPDL